MTAKLASIMVFATMGSNYGDFDNDGFLDMYLGTGDRAWPRWSPTVCSRTLPASDSRRSRPPPARATQKGHGVACGDWDRDGDVDCSRDRRRRKGDQDHNILFQNPGQGNHWLTVKLVGKKTNRAASAPASRS